MSGVKPFWAFRHHCSRRHARRNRASCRPSLAWLDFAREHAAARAQHPDCDRTAGIGHQNLCANLTKRARIALERHLDPGSINRFFFFTGQKTRGADLGHTPLSDVDRDGPVFPTSRNCPKTDAPPRTAKKHGRNHRHAPCRPACLAFRRTASRRRAAAQREAWRAAPAPPPQEARGALKPSD